MIVAVILAVLLVLGTSGLHYSVLRGFPAGSAVCRSDTPLIFCISPA